MGLDKLLRPLSQARKTAKRTPARVLEEATLAGAKRRTAQDAVAAGLVDEAADLERAARDATVEVGKIAAVEKQLVALKPGLRASTDLIVRVTTPPSSRLERLFGRFTLRDRHELGERALRLAKGKSVERALRAENNMAGQLREVVAKHLGEVVEEVRAVARQLRAGTAGSGTRAVIDSARHGAVELPTRMRQSNRFIRLGTDRIVGVGTAAPQRVPITWSDGTRDVIEVAGELDVSLAIEVKGRTTVTGGIEQLRALQQRGQPGYAIIGNQLWLVRYDPAKVTHVVVAPPGDELATAKKLAKAATAAGSRTKVVGIPLDLDYEIKAMARHYLTEAATAQP